MISMGSGRLPRARAGSSISRSTTSRCARETVQLPSPRDLAVVHTLGDALKGTGKPFVGTSGTLALASAHRDRAGTEEDVVTAPGTRIEAENAVIGFAEEGVRSSVVRVPPI